jgi:hypothetical protein
MKTIAALTMFGVLALASAGTSGARGELGPTPGQPDPARVVLRSADLGGARMTAQGYYREQGLIISYSRTFTMARVGGTPLLVLESDAGVAQSGPDANDAVGYFRRYASTARGRAELKSALQGVDSSGLVISHVSVGAPRHISGTNGWDVALSFRVLGLPAQAHIALFSGNRFLGGLLIIGAPGRSVPPSTVAALARVMTRRFYAAQPPKNLTAPSIAGTAAVGLTLTASPGTWANAPTSYRYQWGRCDAQNSCNNIQGATSSRYIPSQADASSTLRVWVTAINANGARNAVSAATDPVIAAPTAAALPTITGNAVAGELLTASTGTWTGAPTSYSFGWQLCDAQAANCTAAGGTLQDYRLGPTDVGHRLVAVVTATNAAGSTTVASQPTAVVEPGSPGASPETRFPSES